MKFDFKKIWLNIKKFAGIAKDWIIKVFRIVKDWTVKVCKKGFAVTKDWIKSLVSKIKAKIEYKKAHPKEKKKVAVTEKKKAVLAEKNTASVKKEPASKKTAESKKTAAKKDTAKKDDEDKKKAALLKTKKELTPEQKKKIAYIISAILGLIIIILLLLGIRSCAGNSKAKREAQALEQQQQLKQNIMTSAVNYADKGEFDRALDKLDSYIDQYGEDPDVRDLINLIIDAKNAAKDSGNSGFDTSAFSDAMANALDKANRQADEYRKIIDDLKEQNRNSSGNNNGNNNSNKGGNNFYNYNNSDVDDFISPDDEQQKLAEQKRKEEESELAKQNAALKKKIDALNDEIQKGKNDLSAGNTNGGITHFNKALTLIPEEAGKDYSADKKAEMAQAYYDTSEKTSNPQDKNTLMKEAVNMANKALQDNAKQPAAHFILAKDALNKNDLNKALSEMQAAVNGSKADDPNLYLYYYELGKIQYRLKKFNEAVTSFTKSCELKNDFSPSRYNLGLTQKQLKNDNAALAAFRKTIDIDPRHEKAYLEQGRILAARNDYSGAIDAYKSVLTINSVNSSAAMELGSVYYKKKDYKNAEEMYRRAITMLNSGEELTLTKYNLSTVLFDAGKVTEAVKYAKEAYDNKNQVKNNTSKANVIYNYALVLDQTGKTEDAILIYKEVLGCNPNHLKTKINLAVMYMNLNPPDTDSALTLLLQVYKNEPSNFEANNNLGSVYLKIEDYGNAIRFFQNALKIDPKNNTVRENLAKAYASNKDFHNAQTMYSEVLKYDKENWDAYIELAKVCIQLDDYTSAEKYLQYVQDRNPSYRRSEVMNLLGANEK